MTSESNTKRERIYRVIIILIFIATNVYFYLIDPPSIFQFLGIELFYLLLFGLYELFTLGVKIKYKQNDMDRFDRYFVLYILLIIQIMPGVVMVVLGYADLSSLEIPLVGSLVMVIWFFFARAIVRQALFAIFSPESRDTSQQPPEL